MITWQEMLQCFKRINRTDENVSVAEEAIIETSEIIGVQDEAILEIGQLISDILTGGE